MLLIENGYMIDPKSGREGSYDILTEGTRIRRIGRQLRREMTAEELADPPDPCPFGQNVIAALQARLGIYHIAILYQ